MSPDVKFKLELAVLGLAVAIGAGFIPGLDTFQQIIFSALTFLCLISLEFLWILSKNDELIAKEQEIRAAYERGDREISNIQIHFRSLVRESYGKQDLFVQHFVGQLRTLERIIREVAERKQLRVQADHFLSADNVLNAFQTDDETVVRYTWLIESDEPLFNLSWGRYFEKTTQMAANGQISEIKAILMVEDYKVLDEPRYRKLLDFFKTNRGLICRIMLRKDYAKLCADNTALQDCDDFGIYGSTLLFMTEEYEPEIKGVFSKDQALIEAYRVHFDTMWTSLSVTKTNPSSATTPVTLEELFKANEPAT